VVSTTSHKTALDIKYWLSLSSNEASSQDWFILFDVKTTAISFMFVCPFPDVVQQTTGRRVVLGD
jgi:hypothetical protein